MSDREDSPEAIEQSIENIRFKMEFYEKQMQEGTLTRYQKGKYDALKWVFGDLDEI